MIVALNNKCNFTKNEYLQYQEELINKITTTNKLILCPSFPYLSLFNNKDISLGSQNVSAYSEGPHTGEVSATQLKELSVKYTIVGHSERREEQNETSKTVNQKIKCLLKEDIIPIMCIGETKESYELGKTKDVLFEELQEGLIDLTAEEKEKIIIAYEPIWAIGTGLIPTNTEIFEVINYIKEFTPKSKVLYGGSANQDNIDTLKNITNIDGYLLGGISLHPEKLQVFLEKLEN